VIFVDTRSGIGNLSYVPAVEGISSEYLTLDSVSKVYQKLDEFSAWSFVCCLFKAYVGGRLWTFGEVFEGNAMPALGLAWRVSHQPHPRILKPLS
jgi:hypothetical protein